MLKTIEDGPHIARYETSLKYSVSIFIFAAVASTVASFSLGNAISMVVFVTPIRTRLLTARALSKGGKLFAKHIVEIR